jgi:uncharacterized membrane protein (UPF0136 family)
MKKTAWILFGYALFILIGGIIGHFKAGSQASLIMGLVFGLLLMVLSVLMIKRKKPALYAAFGLTIILDVFFTYRFIHTHAIFPAAVLSIISLAMVIILGLKIRKL